MKNLTVRLPEEEIESIDGEADESELSRAEYLRECIRLGREADGIRNELERMQAEHEAELSRVQDECEDRITALKEQHEAHVDEIRAECDGQLADLQRTIDRLQNEKQLILEQREDTRALVEQTQELEEYVEDEREERLQRQRRRRYSAIRRGWWWLTGEPDLETADG